MARKSMRNENRKANEAINSAAQIINLISQMNDASYASDALIDAIAHNALFETDEQKRKDICDGIESAVQKVGKSKMMRKWYTSISRSFMRVLWIDSDFQRMDNFSKAKLRKLLREFDVFSMDAIKVSYHEETHLYSVIDGMHRLIAAWLLNLPEIPVEILYIPGTPEERKKVEAKIFSTQANVSDNPSKLAKHKSEVILEDPKATIIEKVASENGYVLREAKNLKAGELAYGAADYVLNPKNGGSGTVEDERFDWIMKVIKMSMYDQRPNGMSGYIIRPLANIYNAYKGNLDGVAAILSREMKSYMPRDFKARACSNPSTNTIKDYRNAIACYMSNLISENGIQRI